MGAGRPTKYKPEFCDKAFYFLSRHGFDIVDLAKIFDVDRDTIYAWKATHKEFSDAVQKGRCPVLKRLGPQRKKTPESPGESAPMISGTHLPPRRFAPERTLRPHRR